MVNYIDFPRLKQSYNLPIYSTSSGCIILYVIHICIFHIFICIFIFYIYLNSICQYFVKNFCIYVHEDWGSFREILIDKFNFFNGARNFPFFCCVKNAFQGICLYHLSDQIIRMKFLLIFFYYHFNAWRI